MESSLEGAEMQVGASAKPNSDTQNQLEFAFQTSFIEVSEFILHYTVKMH